MPRSGVRPTQDRVRQALFSMLSDRVEGARFADVYAGSGAVGLEAWSRGASAVCWVERDDRAYSFLRDNVMDLCGRENVRLVNCSATRFLERAVPGGFDLIFCDPPYECGVGELTALQVAVANSGVLASNGLLVLEVSARVEVPLCGCSVVDDRTYGESRLLFLYFDEAPRRGNGDIARKR